VSTADEFESTAENPLLVAEIRARLERQGRMTFRDFMEMALYHPRHGYYRSPREKMGRAGDYLTSPEVHPLFGHMVGRQLAEMWEVMGSPARFDLLEMGAGNGLLARDILRWAQRLHPAFLKALTYRIAETSPALVERQRHTLEALGLPDGKATWEPGEAPVAGSVSGCLLSNELVDSFPVHRVAVEGGELLEVHVVWQEGRFQEELGPPSTPELGAYFERLGLLPGEGCRAEVNLAALAWMRQVAAALARGFVLTFDYGHEARDLYAPWRRDGTLLCFYRHNPSPDPYVRVGKQDMTAHVDFTSLVEEGRRHGLEALGFTTQSRFLAALGIGEALAAAPGAELPLEEYYARRRAVSELLDPAGLGRIHVLVQAKGVAPCKLRGLAEGAVPGPALENP
jgi:SAM-dependent MidA family methyltransferase